jgi:hypothetical protein
LICGELCNPQDRNLQEIVNHLPEKDVVRRGDEQVKREGEDLLNDEQINV